MNWHVKQNIERFINKTHVFIAFTTFGLEAKWIMKTEKIGGFLPVNVWDLPNQMKWLVVYTDDLLVCKTVCFQNNNKIILNAAFSKKYTLFQKESLCICSLDKTKRLHILVLALLI